MAGEIKIFAFDAEKAQLNGNKISLGSPCGSPCGCGKCDCEQASTCPSSIGVTVPPVTLPTLPSITLPAVTLPAVTLPCITAVTLPNLPITLPANLGSILGLLSGLNLGGLISIAPLINLLLTLLNSLVDALNTLLDIILALLQVVNLLGGSVIGASLGLLSLPNVLPTALALVNAVLVLVNNVVAIIASLVGILTNLTNLINSLLAIAQPILMCLTQLVAEVTSILETLVIGNLVACATSFLNSLIGAIGVLTTTLLTVPLLQVIDAIRFFFFLMNNSYTFFISCNSHVIFT